MNVRLLSVFACALSFSGAAWSTDCPPNDPKTGRPYQLEDSANWCATDHGANEGAQCGFKALSGANVPNLALSGTWDRTNMIGAAKAAYKAGAKDKAVEVVICCQVHNDHMHACMAKNPQAVSAWLAAHQ